MQLIGTMLWEPINLEPIAFILAAFPRARGVDRAAIDAVLAGYAGVFF